MEINVLQYMISIAAFMIFSYLFYLGKREKLIRQLPIFYIFLAWIMGRSILGWFVVYQWGYGSNLYYYYFYLSSLIFPLLQILLLLKIYYVIKSNKDKGQWLLLAAFTAMMGYFVLNEQVSSFFEAFHTISLYFQVLFCTLVHVQLQRSRQVYLGRNYEGILYGLTIMIMAMSITYGLRVFEGLPGEKFNLLTQGLAFVPWLIYAYYLRKLDLPRNVDPEVIRELELAEAGFKGALRSIR